jgi:hypothetical protein
MRRACLSVNRTEFGLHVGFISIGIAGFRSRNRKLGCAGSGRPDLF